MTLAARTLRRICVFCGSNVGHDPLFEQRARELGQLLVERDLGLVYGGGDVGLMGVIADTVMEGGGEVIGVIPRSLRDREVAHGGITELHVVETMHQRKNLIYSLGDAVIAMPGGIGTFEELFEALTWNQLEIHFKPAGLLNVAGYWDPLVAMLDSAVEMGFLRASQRRMLAQSDSPEELLDLLTKLRPDHAPKWVRPGEAEPELPGQGGAGGVE